MPKIMVGADIRRLSLDALAKGARRRHKLAARLQRFSKPEPGLVGVGSVGKEGLEHPDGGRVLAALRHDLSQAIKRVQIVRLDVENLPKAGLGLGVPAGPMVFHRTLKHERQAPAVQSSAEILPVLRGENEGRDPALFDAE